MRYALISDIHANLPALEAVLADIRSRSNVEDGMESHVSGVYHLGDLVGYAPWPNEVCKIVADAGIPGVAGNYDSTVATDYKNCGCRAENPHQEELAHQSYEWTREHIDIGAKEFLRELPFRIDIRPAGGHVSGPTVTLVHATPLNNLIYVDESRPDTFLMKMADAAGLKAGDVLAFGHTHKPWHRTVGGVHFINTGSVGRPKDGDWRAGYVLLDVNVDVNGTEVRSEIVRVEYDVDAALRGVRESDLPQEFAEFLQTGGKPLAASDPR
jgi:predicted phosphodiesterase